MIFPNLWPADLARSIYTWSQNPEIIIVPGKEKIDWKKCALRDLRLVSPNLFLLNIQSQFELPDHSLFIRLVYVIHVTSKNSKELYFCYIRIWVFLTDLDAKERSH